MPLSCTRNAVYGGGRTPTRRDAPSPRFPEWDGDRWRERALRVPQRANSAEHPQTSLEHNGPLEEGLRSYALRQASVRKRLFGTFAKQWNDVPAFIAIADRGLTDDTSEGELVDSVM